MKSISHVVVGGGWFCRHFLFGRREKASAWVLNARVAICAPPVRIAAAAPVLRRPVGTVAAPPPPPAPHSRQHLRGTGRGAWSESGGSDPDIEELIGTPPVNKTSGIQLLTYEGHCLGSFVDYHGQTFNSAHGSE